MKKHIPHLRATKEFTGKYRVLFPKGDYISLFVVQCELPVDFALDKVFRQYGPMMQSACS